MKALLKATFIAATVIACGSTFTANAQTKKAKEDPNKVYVAVEKAAEFPGGIKTFGAYLAKTIKYPEAARKNNVQGRVFVQFIVEKDGSLADMKVKRGIGSGCDEEAIKALQAGPKWVPAKQKGAAVRSQYVVPINFTLAKG